MSQCLCPNATVQSIVLYRLTVCICLSLLLWPLNIVVEHVCRRFSFLAVHYQGLARHKEHSECDSQFSVQLLFEACRCSLRSGSSQPHCLVTTARFLGISSPFWQQHLSQLSARACSLSLVLRIAGAVLTQHQCQVDEELFTHNCVFVSLSLSLSSVAL